MSNDRTANGTHFTCNTKTQLLSTSNHYIECKNQSCFPGSGNSEAVRVRPSHARYLPSLSRSGLTVASPPSQTPTTMSVGLLLVVTSAAVLGAPLPINSKASTQSQSLGSFFDGKFQRCGRGSERQTSAGATEPRFETAARIMDRQYLSPLMNPGQES